MPKRLHKLIIILSASLTIQAGYAQDDLSSLGDIELPQQRMPLCFGFSDIGDEKALAVCDALNLDENVRARELAEQWVRAEPDSPAAQFALAEVLLQETGIATLPGTAFGREINELSLRLSYVDFDGDVALQNVETMAEDDPAVVTTLCPRIELAMTRLSDWVARL